MFYFLLNIDGTGETYNSNQCNTEISEYFNVNMESANTAMQIPHSVQFCSFFCVTAASAVQVVFADP